MPQDVQVVPAVEEAADIGAACPSHAFSLRLASPELKAEITALQQQAGGVGGRELQLHVPFGAAAVKAMMESLHGGGGCMAARTKRKCGSGGEA